MNAPDDIQPATDGTPDVLPDAAVGEALPAEEEQPETAAPVVVRIEHIHAAGYCARGGRAFAARHGLDWSAFLRDGIPAEVLEATGDFMAEQVVEKARG